MTLKELSALVGGLAQVFREYRATVNDRMAALELKEKGLDGKEGPIGPAGPDGKPGRDGRDGLPGWPGEKGVDGKDGRDGVDGFGFDDFEETFDGERTYTKRYVKGDQVKEFTSRVPFVIDRGVYVPGKSYDRGDAVSFAGSLFIAQRDTKAGEKPEDSSKAWRLAVKRGRDGGDGKEGKAGAPGRDGKDRIASHDLGAGGFR